MIPKIRTIPQLVCNIHQTFTTNVSLLGRWTCEKHFHWSGSICWQHLRDFANDKHLKPLVNSRKNRHTIGYYKLKSNTYVSRFHKRKTHAQPTINRCVSDEWRHETQRFRAKPRNTVKKVRRLARNALFIQSLVNDGKLSVSFVWLNTWQHAKYIYTIYVC